jgi:hypothetical protein
VEYRVLLALRLINPYSDDPRYDLDMAGSSLVKYYGKGRHGTAYPDTLWEPKGIVQGGGGVLQKSLSDRYLAKFLISNKVRPLTYLDV